MSKPLITKKRSTPVQLGRINKRSHHNLGSRKFTLCATSTPMIAAHLKNVQPRITFSHGHALTCQAGFATPRILGRFLAASSRQTCVRSRPKDLDNRICCCWSDSPVTTITASVRAARRLSPPGLVRRSAFTLLVLIVPGPARFVGCAWMSDFPLNTLLQRSDFHSSFRGDFGFLQHGQKAACQETSEHTGDGLRAQIENLSEVAMRLLLPHALHLSRVHSSPASQEL
jgi:hypothetical protein